MRRAATPTRADAARAAAAQSVAARSSRSFPEASPFRQINKQIGGTESIRFDPRTRISASARNKEKGENDRDQIFADGDKEILDVQIPHQAAPDFIASECSDHASYSSKDCPGK